MKQIDSLDEIKPRSSNGGRGNLLHIFMSYSLGFKSSDGISHKLRLLPLHFAFSFPYNSGPITDSTTPLHQNGGEMAGTFTLDYQ